jgi:hypothetical protein
LPLLPRGRKTTFSGEKCAAAIIALILCLQVGLTLHGGHDAGSEMRVLPQERKLCGVRVLREERDIL